MPTIIRLAKSTQELNDILDFRFQIQTQIRPVSRDLQATAHKLIDPLDVFPTTRNVLASFQGKPVATLRLSEVQNNHPIQNYSYSFDESARNVNGKSFLFDMFCVDSQFSQDALVIKNLFNMALKTLSDHGIENAFFLSPLILQRDLESLGFEKIQNSFFCPKHQVDVVPMRIAVQTFLHFFESGFKDKELFRFKEIFYFMVFNAGEILAAQGERGVTAFLLTAGEVEVLLRKGPELLKLATLTNGSLIGEIAMLTSEPRTASLIASQRTSCVSFDRSDFLRLMYAEPHRSLDIFKIFSKRLTDSNLKLAEAQSNGR